MTRSEAMVRVERKSKRKNDSIPAPVHDPDSDSDDQETIGHAMPQPHQPPQEEVPQKQEQQPQGEIIDISSGSKLAREPEPIPLRVLVPKVEADLEASPRELLLTNTLLRLRNDEQPSKKDDNGPALHQEEEEEPQQQQQQQQEEEEEKEQQQQQQQQQQPQKEEHPSQSIVEVVPIPATQDVIEINSDDEDPESRPIKMLIPKVEKCVASSPASMLITDVLMNMAEDAAIEPHLKKNHNLIPQCHHSA
ncbi:hypothetical protein PIB30_012400 [Stylosanthes scabra]|uniref:Uncharacterized protein n=1 Tax=Stylosanthes scabra TaxID=79078 RepID=A0ABU6R5W8_9FABA|nr:hypothetical protein [Stylosanthes scabra]